MDMAEPLPGWKTAVGVGLEPIWPDDAADFTIAPPIPASNSVPVARQAAGVWPRNNFRLMRFDGQDR
jgi:hypothetical protein